MIDRKDVEHVARLARLALSEAELERMRSELAAILQYVEKLNTVDVEGVEPTAHAVPLVNVMREDEVEPSFDREAMMRNAPDRAGEFFRVPRIIED
jgi:aspartyl-tRNA(Asn)/glutamyl-tRNA(Gln) amidotransferase subunit C